jgi:hypothetical protein
MCEAGWDISELGHADCANDPSSRYDFPGIQP